MCKTPISYIFYHENENFNVSDSKSCFFIYLIGYNIRMTVVLISKS